jgi:hypothetical protein
MTEQQKNITPSQKLVSDSIEQNKKTILYALNFLASNLESIKADEESFGIASPIEEEVENLIQLLQ